MSMTKKGETNRTVSGTTTAVTFTGNAANRLLIAPFRARASAAISPSIADNTSGGSLTWLIPEGFQANNTGGVRLGVGIYRVVRAGNAVSYTVTVTHVSTNIANLEVFEEDDYDLTTPVRQGKFFGNSATASLSGNLDSAPLSNSTVFACMNQNGTSCAPGGSGGFTESEDGTYGSGATYNRQNQTRTGSTSTVVDWGSLNSVQAVAAAIEIASGAPPADPPNGTPSGLVTTPVNASQINLAWTSGSTNEDETVIQEAPESSLTGTVAVTNGSTAIVGTGTAFLSQLSIGKIFRVAGETADRYIATITNDNNATLTAAIARSTNSGLAAVTAGTFVTVDSVATPGVTYSRTGRSPDTLYFYRVYESNTDGDSANSNVVSGRTYALPSVSIVDPAGSILTAVTGIGQVITLVVSANDAVDGALTDGDLSVDDSVEGHLGTPTGSTFVVNVDSMLPTLGSHGVSFTATNARGDTNSGGWTINVVNIGASNKILTEGDVASIPMPFGVGGPLPFVFRDGNGLLVDPAFVTGDVKYVKIDALGNVLASGNAQNLPQLGVFNEHVLVADPSERDCALTVYVVKDQTSPAAWVAVPGYIYSYGDPDAFYTEEVEVLGSDAKALISADVTGVASLPALPGAVGPLLEMITAMYHHMLSEGRNNKASGLAEIKNEDGDVIATTTVTVVGDQMTRPAYS